MQLVLLWCRPSRPHMHVQLLLWLDGHEVDLLGSHTCGASHLHINRGDLANLMSDMMEGTGRPIDPEEYNAALNPPIDVMVRNCSNA